MGYLFVFWSGLLFHNILKDSKNARMFCERAVKLKPAGARNNLGDIEM
jgi:hypothetical protein